MKRNCRALLVGVVIAVGLVTGFTKCNDKDTDTDTNKVVSTSHCKSGYPLYCSSVKVCCPAGYAYYCDGQCRTSPGSGCV